MTKKTIFALIFLIEVLSMNASPIVKGKHTFEIKDGHFMLDGKPTQIISGEIHSARTPHQYWRQRLQMLKAMGANTVATYVFWNEHEIAPGKWDWTGDRNLAEFIKTAQEEGLMVILRPGPYACAEWEFGGYPWFLQNVKGLQLRRDNAAFLEHTKEYINQLYGQVKDLQITHGGPIIMTQVENEFGSYVAQRPDISLDEHRRYNAKIKDQILAAGFDVSLFTSDGDWLFKGGTIEGILPTANGEGNIANLKKAINEYHNGKGPYMVAEFYPGWLDHWGEEFSKTKAGSVARQTEKFMKEGISFNIYMAQGGTNFGFMSGANYNDDHDIEPSITSYDYDAPISEAGWETPKFDSIRNVIKKYVSYKIPKVPKAVPVIEIPSIKLSKIADVLAYAKKLNQIESDSLLTFEELNQGYGYVLYSRHFNQPISGKMEVSGLRDYAVVYVNGKKIGVLNRFSKKYTLDVKVPFNSTLQLLVENMGRINFGSEIIHNTKGIISPIKIGDNEIDGDWQMTKLPMSICPDLDTFPESTVYENTTNEATSLLNKPVLYAGTFNLDQLGDTFLDMEDWGKGIVFINGKNLGRYWGVGPQQTLYLPGVWLKKGENKIVIFEQKNGKIHTEVKGVKTPVLEKLKPEKLE